MPFNKKMNLARIAQQRNEKKFAKDQSMLSRMGHVHKYRKGLLKQLRQAIEYEVSPNAINDKKVKLWSQLLAARSPSGEKSRSPGRSASHGKKTTK